jgi:hypothetical protein
LVYQDTAAIARGQWAGLTGDLALTVLDTIPDNFGSYAGRKWNEPGRNVIRAAFRHPNGSAFHRNALQVFSCACL